MKTLTNADCSEWLTSRKLAVAPYNSLEPRPQYQDQFKLPQHAPNVSTVFRTIIACAEPFGEALLHIIDPALYEPDEMAIVSHIRHACGENRPLIETPGHAFIAAERDLLIGFLALVASYGWTAYLYIDHGLTMLSWEGELLDLFATDAKSYDAVCKLLRGMGLTIAPPERV